MRGSRLGSGVLGVLALVTGAAFAADGDESDSDTHWHVGLDVMAQERSFDLAGSDYSADGTLAGAYGAWQHASGVRLEGRVLAGGVDYEVDGASASSDPAAYADFEATWAFGLPEAAHLYGGVGARHYTADFDDGGEDTSHTVYVPVGISRSGALHGGWQVRTELEGQVVLASRHEVDLPNNGGSADFDHYGGFGIEVSALFSHPESALGITPYFHHQVVGDSQTEQIGGSNERISDFEQTSLGVRFTARF